jgi:tetratricopeptide (TPR) repeat protein
MPTESSASPARLAANNLRSIEVGLVWHAIPDYTEAILLDPANANNFNSRCWCRALDGKDLNAALGDCNESVRLRPNDGNTLNSRGLVQFTVGAFDAAIADYNTAVAQNAKDADSLYARGVAKLKKGDTAGGNADIAAAKAIKPELRPYPPAMASRSMRRARTRRPSTSDAPPWQEPPPPGRSALDQMRDCRRSRGDILTDADRQTPLFKK